MNSPYHKKEHKVPVIKKMCEHRDNQIYQDHRKESINRPSLIWTLATQITGKDQNIY